MTGWNMPPGCNESDIPGNRPVDAAWEKWLEDTFSDHMAAAEKRRDTIKEALDGLDSDGDDDYPRHIAAMKKAAEELQGTADEMEASRKAFWDSWENRFDGICDPDYDNREQVIEEHYDDPNKGI